jgi:hypothetical protein
VKRILVAMLACVALTSCARGAALEAQASKELTARVDAIREAVEEGDAARAEVLLTRLHDAVGRLAADGLVSEERAIAIQSAAGDVVGEIALLDAGTTSVSPTTIPSPTVADPDEGDDEDDEDNSGPGNGDEDHDNSGPGNGDD